MPDDFVFHLLDMLRPFGEVEAKAMFGGYGLYRDDRMFAIVSKGTLYIKADKISRRFFEDRGMTQFSYFRKGKEYFRSYWTVPDEAVESPGRLQYWAAIGYQTALRTKRKKGGWQRRKS